MSTTLMIPDLGDANIEGDIVAVLAEIGEQVSEGQILLELETEKVVMEIPAEADGSIESFLVKVGDRVKQGTPYIEMTLTTPEVTELKVAAPPAQTQAAETALVIEPVVTPSATAVAAAAKVSDAAVTAPDNAAAVSAGPAARRLARELGIDISQVAGSGPRSRVAKCDIKNHTRERLQSKSSGHAGPRLPLPDESVLGPTRSEPLSAIQKATARNMSHAVERVPHAWLQQKVDITALEQGRKRHKAKVAEQGGALTLTAILCKVIAMAAEQMPAFNAVLDDDNDVLLYRERVNVGVAVDTPRGLVVPVIPAADQQSIVAISCSLAALSLRAREGKLKPADMKGGSITLSNLGGLGSSGVFPVINWPELAIVGAGSGEWEARYVDGDTSRPPEPRLMMPLTLAFDHRVINGADGARFLNIIKQYCEDPFLMSIS